MLWRPGRLAGRRQVGEQALGDALAEDHPAVNAAVLRVNLAHGGQEEAGDGRRQVGHEVAVADGAAVPPGRWMTIFAIWPTISLPDTSDPTSRSGKYVSGSGFPFTRWATRMLSFRLMRPASNEAM